MERQWPTVLATAVAGVAIAALGIYKSKKEALGAEGNEAQWLVLVRHGDARTTRRRRGGPASRPSDATRETLLYQRSGIARRGSSGLLRPQH